jgi:two-component system cell cycle sensor histidine kinase/response regulator CckA
VDPTWHHSILDSIRDAVIVADADALVVFMNPAAERITEWRNSEGAGRPLSEIFHAVEHDTGKQSAIKHLLAQPLAQDMLHLVLVRKAGTELHIEATASPLVCEGGSAAGTVLLFRDITERILMQEQMMAAQQMEVIGALAGGIAHDFGNVMTLITQHSTSLAGCLIPKTRAHEDALRIVDASAHATTLTKRLLTVARVTHKGSAERTLSPTAIDETASAALELLQETFTASSIDIKLRTPSKMPQILADADELVDIFVNLLLNAAHAMPKGGSITIDAALSSVEKPNTKLNPDAKPGKYVLIRVTDTGVGMPHELLDHIFEPFFTTKEEGTAHGLGLTIVRSAVLSWGGWIRTRTTPGKGSTFSLYVPFARQAIQPAPAKPKLRGLTVLVIDDRPADLATFTSFLREAGHKVHARRSGALGLESFGKYKTSIDACILDLIMPEMGGKEVFDILREDKPDLPIILTSGFSRDYVRGCLGRGGWNFIQKPIEKDALLDALRGAYESTAVQPQTQQQET